MKYGSEAVINAHVKTVIIMTAQINASLDVSMTMEAE
jgi:hypothetical protein